ncbi:MAG TPA: ATP-binding cassette domain-containing protein [Candidatus Limnocylindrales bacterium]
MAEPVAVVAVSRPTIHVRDVVKSFAGRVVVDVDDLVLGTQPIEGLIGPNGAGKTTLMRLLMHSTSLDRGTIVLVHPDGREVVLSRLPAHRLAGLGVVKSNQVIMDFDKLTIWDSLLLAVAEARYEEPYRMFSEQAVFQRHEDEIRHYLDYFGLPEPTRFALSAGEKKLLDIVRCLLLRPKFLLLDEPTAGLPEDLTEKVMEVIRVLAASGTSVVIVEHDLNLIWSLCDEVLFMAEGKVILRGDPASIRANRVVVEKYLGEGHV